MEPLQVVEEFIDAVNAGDLDRIVRCFSSTAIMQDDSGTAFAQGQDAIRAHFGGFLPQSPNMHADVVARFQVGAWVIQEERCSGLILEEPVPEFRIAVAYRVEEGKVVKCMGLQPDI